MNNSAAATSTAPSTAVVSQTVFPILFAISFSHFLNDMMQATITSVYPMIKLRYQLTFAQVGMITFVFQLTASILQPFVGNYTDKNPKPYSFAVAMLFSLTGIILLAYSFGYESILFAVALVGIGSSIFHPEASKVAYYASGGKRGLAQSIFQLGGNGGSAVGPLLVALIVAPYGLHNLLWFLLAAVTGIIVLLQVGNWYKGHLALRAATRAVAKESNVHLTKRKVVVSVVILLVLIFSKYFYLAGMTSYFTFYLIDQFHLTVQQSQLYLFIFLGAVAAGTLLGGSLGDRFGRKIIIWISILGAAPFTIMLPFANLFWTGILAAVIGVIIASAFSAILVYAQELLPGKIGMVSGLFFGFAFGMGGLGSALLGYLADHTSLTYVFSVCSFLPLIGIMTAFLPDLRSENGK